MKTKMITSMIALAAATSLMAGNPAPKDNGKIFVGLETSVISQSDENILGEQPVKDIIGDKSTEQELRIGIGSRYQDGSDRVNLYLFAWRADVNDEIGFGIGGNYVYAVPSHPKLGLMIGAGIGYGWQPVKGDEFYVSTNATRTSYVIGSNIQHGRFKAQYQDDTAILRIALELGVDYRVSDNIAVDLKYRLLYNDYQFEYTIDGVDGYNSLSQEVYSHAATIGISFYF